MATVFTNTPKSGRIARAVRIAVVTVSKLPGRRASASWLSASGPCSENSASSRKGTASAAKAGRAIIVPIVPIEVRIRSFLASLWSSMNRGWIVGSPPVKWTFVTPRSACLRKTVAICPKLTPYGLYAAMRSSSEQNVQRSGQV